MRLREQVRKYLMKIVTSSPHVPCSSTNSNVPRCVDQQQRSLMLARGSLATCYINDTMVDQNLSSSNLYDTYSEYIRATERQLLCLGNWTALLIRNAAAYLLSVPGMYTSICYLYEVIGNGIGLRFVFFPVIFFLKSSLVKKRLHTYWKPLDFCCASWLYLAL